MRIKQRMTVDKIERT